MKEDCLWKLLHTKNTLPSIENWQNIHLRFDQNWRRAQTNPNEFKQKKLNSKKKTNFSIGLDKLFFFFSLLKLEVCIYTNPITHSKNWTKRKKANFSFGLDKVSILIKVRVEMFIYQSNWIQTVKWIKNWAFSFRLDRYSVPILTCASIYVYLFNR